MGTHNQNIASQGAANKSVNDIVSDALNAAGFTGGSIADRTMAFFQSLGASGTILMAVSDPVAPVAQDVLLQDFLESEGYTVTLAASTAALPNTGYDLAIVTESGAAGSAANNSIAACALPVIHMETNWNTTGFATVGASSPGVGNILDLMGAHAISAGLPDPMTFRNFNTACYGVSTANLAAGAVDIAEHGSFPGHCLIAAIDTGGTYAAGTVPATAPARRVAFGIGITSVIVSEWTADAYTLFLQAVEWASNTSGGGSLDYTTMAEYFRYHLGVTPDPLIDPSELA